MTKKVLLWMAPAGLFCILGVIVVYKAANVPATFDEVDTWWTYTGISKIWDAVFNTHNNTNNHILNSLSITVCQFIFGVKLWTLRLPNIISFFLFGASMLVLAKRYFNNGPLLLCIPFVCMFLNPYLLDFFSLARGYGMANACMACSITGLLLFSDSGKMRWYYLTVVFAMMAAYANFAFLIFWVAVHALLLVNFLLKKYEWQYTKKVMARTVYTAIAFVALCAVPLTNIQKCLHDNFYYSGGFYRQTLVAEAGAFFYKKPFPGLSYQSIAALVIVVVLAAVVVGFVKIRRNLLTAFTGPFNLVLLLLLLVWGLNVLQVNLSGTAYPVCRTGLMYYVLFMYVFIFLLREMDLKKLPGNKILMAVTCLFFVVHFALSVTLKSVYEWSYDAYTADVMNCLNGYRREHPDIKRMKFKPADYFMNSFTFYMDTHNVNWIEMWDPLDEIMRNNLADTVPQAVFYYTASHREGGLKNHTVLKTFTATGLPAPVADTTDVADKIQVLYIK